MVFAADLRPDRSDQFRCTRGATYRDLLERREVILTQSIKVDDPVNDGRYRRHGRYFLSFDRLTDFFRLAEIEKDKPRRIKKGTPDAPVHSHTVADRGDDQKRVIG